MTLSALEGAAGCGKTYRLMELLADRLINPKLAAGQRVLALTFMHGARRRLADKLATVPGLNGRFDCSTVDGFAWRLVRRWRGLATALNIPDLAESEFDAVCDAAGALLEQDGVASWVAASFPITLVDEGQDLHPERLRILKALTVTTDVFVAADEFQCLSSDLRPNPLVTWINEAAEPDVLTQVRRTNVGGLLNAATAIRSGQPPVNSGQHFKIFDGKSVPLASTLASNAIGWNYNTQNVAIITPSRSGGFAQRVVDRIVSTASNQGNGPYSVVWEGSDDDERRVILAGLAMSDEASALETVLALQAMPNVGPVKHARQWVLRQISAVGRVGFTRVEIEEVVGRFVTLRRQQGGHATRRFAAMTVHQAKNREFDGVIVLWPFSVAGDADQKRRLLYNAVTRAKRWCTVIVQGASILSKAPFG